MPRTAKTGWSQLKVGIMALLALAILFALVFLLTGVDNPFADKAELYTHMRDSAAMTVGSGVRLNGILIGKVTDIRLTNDPDLDRSIRMTLQIDREHLGSIPVDSELGFSAESVLGAKFLNIRRGESREAMKDRSEIKSRDDRDFLEIVQSAMPLFQSVQSILNRLDKVVAIIERGEGSIGKLIVSEEAYGRFNSILTDMQKVSHSLSTGEGTVGRLLYDGALYDDFRQSLARLDAVVAGLQRGEGTVGKLMKDPALYDELRQTTAEIRTLVADLNAGKGTAGKLLKDPEMHDRLAGTLDRLNQTMDQINSGQGTLGQMMVNPALYENLAGTTAEMQQLMKDFRANPKKFLTIQLRLF